MAPAGSLGGLGPDQAQAADQWGDWTEQYHATHTEASRQCDEINAGISEFGTCRGTPYITSSPYGSNSRLFVWRMIGTQEVCDMEMHIGSRPRNARPVPPQAGRPRLRRPDRLVGPEVDAL
jgi:hypothetical protein